MSSFKIDIEKLREDAKLSEPENKAVFARLKKRKPKNLDDLVHKLHYEVFDKIDCLECGNCCKSRSPIITYRDVDKLSKHFRIKPSAFISQYLATDKDANYVFKQTPCPFLMADNSCMVYEQRPRACKEYPYTAQKKIYQILPVTLENIHNCPGLYEIIDKLKKEKNIF